MANANLHYHIYSPTVVDDLVQSYHAVKVPTDPRWPAFFWSRTGANAAAPLYASMGAKARVFQCSNHRCVEAARARREGRRYVVSNPDGRRRVCITRAEMVQKAGRKPDVPTTEERLASLENFRTQSLDVFDKTLAVLQSIEQPGLLDNVVASLQSQSADIALLKAALT